MTTKLSSKKNNNITLYHGINQGNSVNSVLFTEIIDFENEEQFILNKRLMILDALKFPGCFNAELLAPIPKLRREWITIIQFQNEDFLFQWLNSEEYMQRNSFNKAYVKSSQKQFLSDFNRQVSHLITTKVPINNQQKWLEWHGRIYEEMVSFPGFIGSDIQPLKIKQDKNSVTWIVNFQFQDSEKLLNWLNSRQRIKLMEEGEKLYQAEASSVSNIASGFGSWFNMKREDGSTVAGWKMALIVEMALYPLLIAQVFLTPFIGKWFVLPIALLINSFYGCFLMQYLLVPEVQKMMKFWLLPQKKQEKQINLIGVLLSILYLLIVAFVAIQFLRIV